MTRKEIEKKIEDLEKRLANTTDIKRETFLKATINRYSEDLGKKKPYKW